MPGDTGDIWKLIAEWIEDANGEGNRFWTLEPPVQVEQVEQTNELQNAMGHGAAASSTQQIMKHILISILCGSVLAFDTLSKFTLIIAG